MLDLNNLKLISKRVLIGFLGAVILTGLIVSQNFQKKITDHQKNLKKLQTEIKNYESKLSSKSQSEKSELEKLNDVNGKIGLLQQLIGELEKGRQITEANIATLRVILEQTQDELARLKKLTSQRLVQVYKHREEDPLAFILTSQSLTQAYSRMKYLKIITDQDKKDLSVLRRKKNSIVSQKKQIEGELLMQTQLIRLKKNEKASLDGELKKRTQALQKIRKDKKLLASLIEQRKDDIETMQTLIAELERKKKEQEALEEANKQKALAENKTTVKTYKRPVYEEKSNFIQYKGKLPLPAAGRIVKKFGDHIHPVLGTKTRNPGVDILTNTNSEVHAVAKGRVSVVTWLRRFGNTLLIDHGGGYYTVYAHLGEIYVNPDQTLNAGDVIARVDESDEGQPILHFGVYKSGEPLDPQGWLK
ncbi:peptidoglycan DD-metalloendopeptidase family protein [bacterium]|nr:peptidoglycan DD-metalloendopeptidase family protein [bacterium]